MATPIDVRPLLAVPDRAAVAAFRAQHRAQPGYGIGFALGPVLIIVVGLVFASAALAFGFPVGTIPLIIGGLAVLAGVLSLATGGRRWQRMTRLASFAAANGLGYLPRGDGPALPGAIFGHGSARFAKDRFWRAAEPTVDYGNYEYSTGSGKSRRTHQWWYLAMRLERRLPHMVLDSRANNLLFGTTNLPQVFARDQVLGLEGDFDRFFTLYCPREYERDALYVFTPDLMALCIDEAAAFDLEIVDDWLFAYSSKPLNMAEPAVHERAWRLVDTVGAKTLSQTDQYADERTGGRAAFAANAIAPQGARLRRGFPIAAIFIAAIAAAIFFLPEILRLLGIAF